MPDTLDELVEDMRAPAIGGISAVGIIVRPSSFVKLAVGVGAGATLALAGPFADQRQSLLGTGEFTADSNPIGSALIAGGAGAVISGAVAGMAHQVAIINRPNSAPAVRTGISAALIVGAAAATFEAISGMSAVAEAGGRS